MVSFNPKRFPDFLIWEIKLILVFHGSETLFFIVRKKKKLLTLSIFEYKVGGCHEIGLDWIRPMACGDAKEDEKEWQIPEYEPLIPRVAGMQKGLTNYTTRWL